MTRPLACLLCPGRGSYGAAELGSLARELREGPVAEALEEVDAWRAERGLTRLSELDAAPSFRPSRHLAAENAAELVYFATLAHAEGLRERYEITVVAGNSLGWYTALVVAGVLDVRAGWRLVATLARLQGGVSGGQVLTTTIDDDWVRVPSRAEAIERALQEVRARGEDHYVARSIRLGGHEVLAGTEPGIAELLATLPRCRVGRRELPFRLAGHGPFHTRLCAGVAERARAELSGLPVSRPRAWLVDGRGDQHGPWSGDPGELLDYTLSEQITGTFDFSAAVRVVLREHQPDVLVCAGPGDSLRAPVGHVVVAEGYRGLRDRAAVVSSGIVRVD